MGQMLHNMYIDASKISDSFLEVALDLIWSSNLRARRNLAPIIEKSRICVNWFYTSWGRRLEVSWIICHVWTSLVNIGLTGFTVLIKKESYSRKYHIKVSISNFYWFSVFLGVFMLGKSSNHTFRVWYVTVVWNFCRLSCKLLKWAMIKSKYFVRRSIYSTKFDSSYLGTAIYELRSAHRNKLLMFELWRMW